MRSVVNIAGEGAFAVIPCLNERAHIGRVIDELLSDSDWADPLIIVADGGSTDGTRELVEARARRNPGIRLVDNPRRCQAAAVNAAARQFGDRRWMIRVDAHARYSPNYISRLVREAQARPCASVVVAMVSRGEACFQRGVAAAQNSRLGTGGSAHRSAGVAGYVDHGHHALFDVAAFRDVGGYDEGFTHNEDAELDARLARHGHRIWLTRAASMIYYPREEPTALLRQYFQYGRGRARTTLRHRLRPRLRQLLPLAPPIALAALPASVVNGWAVAPLAIWLSAALLYGGLLGVRRGRLCEAMCGVPAALMHLGFGSGYLFQVVQGGVQSMRNLGRPPRDLANTLEAA
jgi:succinoglycan biosynthesis protein ExoA